MSGKESKIGNRINRKAAGGTPSLVEAFGTSNGSEVDTSITVEQSAVSAQPADKQTVVEVHSATEQPMEKPTDAALKDAQQVMGMAQEMTNAYADTKANAVIVQKAEQQPNVSKIPDVVLDILRDFLVGQQVVNSAEFDEIAVDEEKLADTLEQSLGTTGRDLVPIITNALMRKNNTAAAYIAQCLPKNVKKCRECMFRDSCGKSLVSYPCKRVCITLPADVSEAVDIMFKAVPEFRNMTKSSFITTLLRRQVEQYIPEARKRLDEKMLLDAKMEIEATTMANKILNAVGG